MSFNFDFSPHFHRTWLNTNIHTRQQIIDELKSIVELLAPETSVKEWQEKHTEASKTNIFTHNITRTNQSKNQADNERLQPKEDYSFLKRVVQESTIVSEEDNNTIIQKTAVDTQQSPSQKINETINQTIHPQTLGIKPSKRNTVHDELLLDIEAKIDNHLAEKNEKMKKELMLWAIDYLASHNIK